MARRRAIAVRGRLSGAAGLLGAALAALLGVAAAAGQPATLTREQARMRVLDICVLTEARKVGPTVPVVPKCQCYARGMVAAMTEQDLAYLAARRALPSTLQTQAEAVYGRCS